MRIANTLHSRSTVLHLLLLLMYCFILLPKFYHENSVATMLDETRDKIRILLFCLPSSYHDALSTHYRRSNKGRV